MAAAVEVTLQNSDGKYLNKAGKWTAAMNQARRFPSRAQAQAQAKTLGVRAAKINPAPAKASAAKSTKAKAKKKMMA